MSWVQKRNKLWLFLLAMHAQARKYSSPRCPCVTSKASLYKHHDTNRLTLVTSQVEAPYTTNKWQYALVTWKQEDGLTLYMDGNPVASSEAVVPQQGDHMEDSFTHLAVGRNTAGPPYGNTKMAMSSLVFFDHHVSSPDAKKISLYYWGSGKLVEIQPIDCEE